MRGVEIVVSFSESTSLSLFNFTFTFTLIFNFNFILSRDFGVWVGISTYDAKDVGVKHQAQVGKVHAAVEQNLSLDRAVVIFQDLLLVAQAEDMVHDLLY